MQNNEKINILIVDDRVENLLVLESILEVLDINIVKATSGNEALGYMFDYDFAVVLIDVQMPEMDGFETAELMRSSGRTQHIPIIFVTAISKDKNFVFRGYDSGAVDYIFKPIEESRILLSKIKVFIELYAQRKKLIEQAQILEAKVKELDQIKQELESANARLREQSYVDVVTEIPNRNKLDQYSKKVWEEAIREQKPVSMIMIDMDYFKKYNDNYGHIEGDKCLKKVAKAIQETLKRPVDFVARFGGEEFVVILPNVESDAAKIIAEDIRKNIEDLKITHYFSKISPYVTVSCGITSIIPTEADSIERVLNRADKALYLAKTQGRNRVIEHL